MICPLAVFVPEFGARSETFIRRHVQDLLPGRTLVIGGPLVDSRQRDWDATGPLLDLGRVAELDTVRRWLIDYDVQVVLGEYLDASLQWLPLAQTLRLRFFTHAHGYDVSLRLRDSLYRSEYLRYREAAGVITMSQLSRTRLVELGLGPETVHTVPYGVDVAEYLPERVAGPHIRVLSVGRFVAKKAPLLTLEAFREALAVCPTLRLDYVGTGPLFSEALQFVRTTGLDGQVTLHGGQPNAVVQRLMQTADIMVLHSVTSTFDGDEEGLPVAILEAMAQGVAVVSTRHAGIPEAVQDGVTGYLVDERDTGAMARRIAELARDDDRRRTMGRAGWLRALSHFTWHRERTELLRILQLAP